MTSILFGGNQMTQVLRSKYACDVTPKEAWDILEYDCKSILIDCRTDAEWSYVGAPNLSQIAKTVSYTHLTLPTSDLV